MKSGLKTGSENVTNKQYDRHLNRICNKSRNNSKLFKIFESLSVLWIYVISDRDTCLHFEICMKFVTTLQEENQNLLFLINIYIEW